MIDASHILVLVTTVLLRCIAEGTALRVKRECAQSLNDLMSRLEIARNRSEWEVADTCLERYQGVVTAVADNLSLHSEASNSSLNRDANRGGYTEPDMMADGDLPHSNTWADLLVPVNPLGHPWESFWNDFDETWWPFE
jgi:hypothetical protein